MSEFKPKKEPFVVLYGPKDVLDKYKFKIDTNVKIDGRDLEKEDENNKGDNNEE